METTMGEGGTTRGVQLSLCVTPRGRGLPGQQQDQQTCI